MTTTNKTTAATLETIEASYMDGRLTWEEKVLAEKDLIASLTKTDTTSKNILIRASRLAYVTEEATKKGVSISTSPVNPETVWYTIWGHQHPPALGWDRSAKAAKGYLWVGLTSEAPGDVVAVASREDGAPTFATIALDSWEWTVEKMDGIDFLRCDRCKARHHRKRVLFVTTADGGVEQLGGQCAKAASERLRTALAFLAIVAKACAGWGESFSFGGVRTHADPGTLLAFAAAEISLHGYTKGGVTRDAVRGAFYDLMAPGRSRMSAQFGEALDNVSPSLVEDVMAWAANMKDGDFARNMAVALETGSLRLLGTLCYAPEGLRRAQERKVAATAKAKAWPYDPEADTLAAKLATFDAVDLKMSSKVYAKAQGGQLSKGNAKKVERCLSGVWTVMSSRIFEGYEYSTTYVTYQRDDGAAVTWAASGGFEKALGGRVRLQASVGELRENAKYGDERRIRRVTELAV